MITAEVRVNSWNAGDMARAGIGLYTNTSNGDGYNLVFHGTNQVQFLDDKVTWGKAYTFNWQVGTWYWFQLAENNGTLEGKVWAAGTAEPQSWMFQQTGWTNLTKGAPALNGGSASTSAGSSTVSFASVSVTTTSVQPDTATPTPPPTTTLPAPIAGTNYQLVFQDNFPGTSVNPANQNAVSPFGHPVESSNPNFSYSASNVSVANGVATITAQNTGGGYTGTWTGGILNAETHLYQYGYFSVTAKLPAGAGFCPAIWLCHTDAEADATGTLGELDMLEATGGNTAYQTAHTDSGQVYQAKTTNASLTTGYNTYGLLWTPTSVTYYINGVKTGSYNVAIPDQMYMIISLDVCGSNDWVGPPNASTPTTAALDISSVQIYQLS